MIAKVRIAPLEQWCSYTREKAEDNLAILGIVGKPIHIKTNRLGTWHKCDGKTWEVETESSQELQVAIGIEPTPIGLPTFVCEHMLEMD